MREGKRRKGGSEKTIPSLTSGSTSRTPLPSSNRPLPFLSDGRPTLAIPRRSINRCLGKRTVAMAVLHHAGIRSDDLSGIRTGRRNRPRTRDTAHPAKSQGRRQNGKPRAKALGTFASRQSPPCAPAPGSGIWSGAPFPDRGEGRPSRHPRGRSRAGTSGSDGLPGCGRRSAARLRTTALH